MHCRLAKIALLMIGALCLLPGGGLAQTRGQSQPERKAPAKKTPQASLTGCVDQQDGHYVLIHDQSRELIATLEADGFPTEGFAKHVGHKVTVRGTSSPAGTEHPVFKVRSVETLSDSCGPQEDLS